MKLILLLIVLVTIFKISSAALASHTTALLLPDKIKCFKASYIKTVVINAWNYTSLNENAVESLASANSQFLDSVQISFIPSGNAGSNGGEGISDSVSMVKQLNASKAQYDFVWIEVNDVSPGHPWTSDYNTNEALLGSILYGLQSVGIVNVGIFTNKISWERLMDNSSGSYYFPLWYHSTDNQINFNNFKTFGGWKTPTMKEITSGSICDIPNGLSWYPDNSIQINKQ